MSVWVPLHYLLYSLSTSIVLTHFSNHLTVKSEKILVFVGEWEENCAKNVKHTHILTIAKYRSKSGCLRGNKITSLADCVRPTVGGCMRTRLKCSRTSFGEHHCGSRSLSILSGRWFFIEFPLPCGITLYYWRKFDCERVKLACAMESAFYYPYLTDSFAWRRGQKAAVLLGRVARLLLGTTAHIFNVMHVYGWVLPLCSAGCLTYRRAVWCADKVNVWKEVDNS